MNAFLTIAGVIVGACACSWNQSRLNRNEALRQIPKIIQNTQRLYPHITKFEELYRIMEGEAQWLCMTMPYEGHRTEFLEALNEQIRNIAV